MPNMQGVSVEGWINQSNREKDCKAATEILCHLIESDACTGQAMDVAVDLKNAKQASAQMQRIKCMRERNCLAMLHRVGFFSHPPLPIHQATPPNSLFRIQSSF